jgi:uncharacterized phage-associated protein
MITARTVANYYLSLLDENAGDTLSNLKIQKLVYYAQGFHLAMFGVPLFGDSIEAWQHGPVVPTLWRTFNKYGAGSIPMDEARTFKDENVTEDLFNEQQKELLNEVWTVYGQFSGWKLRNMTHDEYPWKSTFQNCEISHDKMKSYFKTLLENESAQN